MAGLDPAIHGAARLNQPLRGLDARVEPGRDGVFVYGCFKLSWQRACMGGWVYIVTNKRNGTIYTGVTSNLAQRAWEHQDSVIEGFTTRYELTRLLLAERHETIQGAPRAWKLALIEASNPEWTDLYARTMGV